MEWFNQNLPYFLAGISVGGQYALIAIGYTMVYGILRLINFAHGDIFMVAGLIMVYLSASLPIYISIPIMIVATVIIGFLIERVAYKPLRQAPRMSIMISAIGVSYLLQNLALYITGGLAQQYPAIPWISDTIEIFGCCYKKSYCDHTDPYHCSCFCTGISNQENKDRYGNACSIQGF